MKLLKRIGIVIFSLILVLLLIGLLLPKTSHVETSVIIHAPATKVFNEVNELHNWESWSPFQKMDPSSTIIYSSPSAGTGASYDWKGKKTGEGKLTIIESIENKEVKCDLDFKGEGKATALFTFVPLANGMQVTWAFDSDTTVNPVTRLMMSTMKGMLKDQFNQGLAALKQVAERASPVDTVIHNY